VNQHTTQNDDLALELAAAKPEMAMAKVIARQVPSVPEMLQAVIERGVTGDNVAALEKMVDLYERMQAKEAEKAFAVAFVGLQAEMPRVKATGIIPGNSGSVRSTFAPYEEIMKQVAPLLQKHGFTVDFSTDYSAPPEVARIIKTCTLTHVGGHKKSNHFAVRIGAGPPKASEAQSDGAAGTFAKRMALCDALNIVVERDTDARVEGGPVTAEVAFDLERRVGELNINKAAFLKYAGATTFAEIPEAKYAFLDEYLQRYEKPKV